MSELVDKRTSPRDTSDEADDWGRGLYIRDGRPTEKVLQEYDRLFGVKSQVTAPSALDTQISGDHYTNKVIQPVEYIMANKLTYLEGNVVKRITRWRDKNGLEDLLKIKHEIDLIIELEGLRV